MNRRSFLGKICAREPFIGTSSVVGATGASEGHRAGRFNQGELSPTLAARKVSSDIYGVPDVLYPRDNNLGIRETNDKSC